MTTTPAAETTDNVVDILKRPRRSLVRHSKFAAMIVNMCERGAQDVVVSAVTEDGTYMFAHSDGIGPEKMAAISVMLSQWCFEDVDGGW